MISEIFDMMKFDFCQNAKNFHQLHHIYIFNCQRHDKRIIFETTLYFSKKIEIVV